MEHFIPDTIVAISTPLGRGGIGIVRLSGPESAAIAGRLFRPRQGGEVSKFRSHTAHFGPVVHPESGETVDEVLLLVMRAPRTYTCEDVVEFHCHGGVMPVRAVLELALKQGARLAEPGEFTRRAFLNGRIDLTQAEAVLDMIQARTEAFLQVSTHQLRGELTRQLEVIREQVMGAYTQLEARINFPEDDISLPEAEDSLAMMVAEAEGRVEDLLATADQGRILREGVKIVICGRPNVGKSSLLNSLLHEPRAIVSPIAGTTRDTIEESAQLEGIPVQLVDTAGILSPRDVIEAEAVRRSQESIASADLVLFLIDGSEPLSIADRQLAATMLPGKTVLVVNKSDLPQVVDAAGAADLVPGAETVSIAAVHHAGLGDLKAMIIRRVLQGEPLHAHGVLVTNLRHVQALQLCRGHLITAGEYLTQKFSAEFVSEELKRAVTCLDQITGRDIDADLLDKIFSEFCIGK